jgi:hypothetical protein
MEVAGLSAARTIMHIDLDGFYAVSGGPASSLQWACDRQPLTWRHCTPLLAQQVEQKRLGLPEGTPLAVLQWDGLIAVNYAAKGRGVTRHMRLAQAKAACPDLVLVHVQTIGAFHSVVLQLVMACIL